MKLILSEYQQYLLIILLGFLSFLYLINSIENLALYLIKGNDNLIQAIGNTLTEFPKLKTDGLILFEGYFLVFLVIGLFTFLLFKYRNKFNLVLFLFSILGFEYMILSWVYFIGCIAPGNYCHGLYSLKFLGVLQIQILESPFPFPYFQDALALIGLIIIGGFAYLFFKSIFYAIGISALSLSALPLWIYYFDTKEFYLHFQQSIPQLYFISNYDLLICSLITALIFLLVPYLLKVKVIDNDMVIS